MRISRAQFDHCVTEVLVLRRKVKHLSCRLHHKLCGDDCERCRSVSHARHMAKKLVDDLTEMVGWQGTHLNVGPLPTRVSQATRLVDYLELDARGTLRVESPYW